MAHRLAAPQGSSGGGAFTLWLQYFMETEVLFDVPAAKFLPAPKVDSAVLRCVRREKPAVEVEDEAYFFRCIRGAFLLRRKTLVNSLSAALPEAGKERVQAVIQDCGLPPRRPGGEADPGGLRPVGGGPAKLMERSVEAMQEKQQD